MTTQNRTGATGALLDEYEKALAELRQVITKVTPEQLIRITDPATTDENCRSIQTILAHVVSSGYGYATSIANNRGAALIRPDKVLRSSVSAYLEDLDHMFVYTEQIFATIKDTELEQSDPALKILTGWEQLYDIEQLTEHAIVHVLRHRRQLGKIIRDL